MKLLLFSIIAVAGIWVLTVALNPWALNIGQRSTPLLYWHGAGTVLSKDGKTYPLYVSFWPGRPSGFHGGGRREGKRKSADLSGTGWLCVAPGTIERMDITGDMYGGYTSDTDSVIDFRLARVAKAVPDQLPEPRILRRRGVVAWTGAGDGSPRRTGNQVQVRFVHR